MALILAIEPDRRQASRVAAIVKNRLHAEIVQADTTEHAVEALAGRVPDLILTSMLLSRKDDAALADWLRESDEAGRHVQTLVIPVLSGSSRDGDDGGGLLSRFTRGKSRDDATTDGCDPEVFAAQIREYLDHAAEERALLREDAEALRTAAQTKGAAAPSGRMREAEAPRAAERGGARIPFPGL
jgi:CheY-like chemotaxis protein